MEEEIKSPLPPRQINSFPTEEKSVNDTVESRLPPQPKTDAPQELPVKKSFVQKLLGNKKVFIGGIIGIVVLIVVLVIVALSGKETETEVVTLNYWGLWEDETVINGVIASFEAKNPNIKINYKRNQLSDYRTRLIGRLEKTGSDEVENVDIFRIHNTWIPMFKSYLAKVPSETINNVGLDSDFFDVYSVDLVESGNYLSIPLMYDGLALFYNKDLVSNDKLPATWWDLEDVAKEVTVKDESGNIKIAGVALGTTGNVDHWSDILGLMMKQNGIDLSEGDSENYTNLQDVLSFYTSFTTQDKVWNETMANSTQAFASGKLAFFIAPSWRVFDIKNLNKDLNFGITTMPQLPVLQEGNDKTVDNSQLTNIHWATYWTEGVNSKGKHQEEAWKFLEYLSSVEGLTSMYTAESQIRDFGEIYPRKSMLNKLSDNWKTQAFVSVADNATSWYLASNTGDDGVNSDMQKYFGDAINSMLAGTKVEDVIEPLKNGVIQTQNKYKLNR